MNKYILKNWCFLNCYLSVVIQGNVYNNPKFEDGTFISTSLVKDIKFQNDHLEVKTKKSIYCLYPEDIDKDYLNNNPDIWKILCEGICIK